MAAIASALRDISQAYISNAASSTLPSQTNDLAISQDLQSTTTANAPTVSTSQPLAQFKVSSREVLGPAASNQIHWHGNSCDFILDEPIVDFSDTALRADIDTRAGSGCPPNRQGGLCSQDTLRQIQPPRLNGIKYFLAWLGALLRRRTSTNVVNEENVDGSQSNPISLGFYPYRDLTSQIERQSDYPIAYGGYGDVHRCTLHIGRQVTEVAVKSLRPHTVSGDVAWCKMGKMLHRELSVWARLENENILPFYGVAFGFGPLPALVCPWAANGTLHRYLTDHGDLNLMDRLKLLCDIANGLDYLHGQEVIHGDLTSANVLISAAGRASLSDFGLSTIHQEFLGTSYFTDSSRGHVRWAAPELFDPANRSAILNEKTDIYSFGSLMLQVLSGKVPFPADNPHLVLLKVSQGERPPRELCWNGRPIPDIIWLFIVTCWDYVQLSRPSSAEVLGFIQREALDLL